MSTFSKNLSKSSAFFIIVATIFLGNCTTYSLNEENADYISLNQNLTYHEPPTSDSAVTDSPNSSKAIEHFAPLLKLYDAEQAFNKIGTPKVRKDGDVYIDSEEASFFTYEENFQVEDRKYTNLVYRVHFSEIPFSLIPFHLSYGKNVGLLFVVTLNEEQEPILFTITHTCGCYKAIMATSFTPDSFFPSNWKMGDEKQKVYGEKLPYLVRLSEEKPNICVAVRPQTHRIMDVQACNIQQLSKQEGFKTAQQFPLEQLRKLKTETGNVSFFHESGIQEGFVKGAVKPWETLLLSWASLDFFVGTDKAYLRKEDSENSFYTSIKPWNRTSSNMSDFPGFLRHWGWNF